MPCCPGVITTPSVPGCSGECFSAADITIPCVYQGAIDNGIDPCGGTYNFDLGEHNDNDQACVSGGVPCAVTYQLISYSTHFSNVTLNPDGTGVATTALSPTVSVPTQLGEIKYRIYCGCNAYSATGSLFICINNLCANQVCPSGQECSPCTGNCNPVFNGGLQ